MKSIITYGSQYGTTKNYAEKSAENLSLSAISYDKIKKLDEYDLIIHFGGLYAGGVKGLKTVVKKLPLNAKLIVVAVGLADPDSESNLAHIRKTINSTLPDELKDNVKIFCLRGGIDYSKLTLVHKGMMKMLYSKIKTIPPEKQSETVKSMIDTYGKTVSYVNFNSLLPIEDYVKALN